VQRGFHGGILPETIFILCCITGSEVREEDSFVLRLMDLGGFGEVKLNHALKFTKEGLLDKILGSIIVGVTVNNTFIPDETTVPC